MEQRGYSAKTPLWLNSVSELEALPRDHALFSTLAEGNSIYLVFGPYNLIGLAVVYEAHFDTNASERDTITVSSIVREPDAEKGSGFGPQIKSVLLDLLAVGDSV